MFNEITIGLATVVAVVSLTFNWVQYQHGVEQARLGGRRSQSDVVYSLVRWLEEPHNLASRSLVFTLPDYTSRDSWDDSQREAALRVVNLYQVAALFQEMGALPPYFLTYFYGSAIARTWEELRPWVVQELRHGDPAGPARGDFERAAADPLIGSWFGTDFTKDHRPRPFSMLWQAAEIPRKMTRAERKSLRDVRRGLRSH